MTSTTTNKPINLTCAVCNLPIEDFELANAQWCANGPFGREDALFVHKGKCSHDTHDEMPYWEVLAFYLEGTGEYPIFPDDLVALLQVSLATKNAWPETKAITAAKGTKFEDCSADNWQQYFSSRSEAIQSVLVSLAYTYDCDREVMRVKFERTALCEAWEADGRKWTRLADKEIERAIKFAKEHPQQPKTPAQSQAIVDYESPELPKNTLPRFEPEKSGQDYVDQLADELTEGTAIPFNFARETLKMLLLAGHPQPPELEFNSQVHGRQYVILLSETAGSGKGESYRRIWDVLRKTDCGEGNFLRQFRYREVMGSQIGSPEHAVVEFGGNFLADPKAKKPEDGKIVATSFVTPNSMNNIAYYDEGKKLLIKDSAGRMSSGLVEMFTSIFEANRYGTGSRRNGRAVVDRANVSMMLHFVRDSFDQAFADSGSGDDGFLSRCTIINDHKNIVIGDWRKADTVRLQALMTHVVHCMNSRREIRFTSEATEARLAALKTIREWEPKIAARLDMLFYQDIMARALFSAAEEAVDMQDIFATPATRAIVDAGIVERAFAWTENQYRTRQSTWPLDVARDKYERMSRVMVVALEKHGKLSQTDLAKFANVKRAGSGGYPVFTRVLRSLPVKEVGKSQRGVPVYTLVE
jgi:hypothetical protein